MDGRGNQECDTALDTQRPKSSQRSQMRQPAFPHFQHYAVHLSHRFLGRYERI